MKTRRDVFASLLSGPTRATDADSVEIVSLVVHTWPKRLDEVAGQILALGGAEIYSRDPRGTLIVVLEAPTQGEIGAKANAIAGLPHVMSAVMAFQGTDTADPTV